MPTALFCRVIEERNYNYSANNRPIWYRLLQRNNILPKTLDVYKHIPACKELSKLFKNFEEFVKKKDELYRKEDEMERQKRSG